MILRLLSQLNLSADLFERGSRASCKIRGINFKEDPRKRGWRRVVPSPNPVDILNKKVIRDLVKRGNIVIAAGGGGVPVYRDEKKSLVGVEAVIDKDLASALLAIEIGADAFSF